MSTDCVWVLSEESPFDDPESSGGCVCGVFATPAAALFELGTWEIGADGMAEITWAPFGPDAYEGTGHGACHYILRRYGIDTEEGLRAATGELYAQRGLPPHPYLALRTEELLALLPREDIPSWTSTRKD